MNIDDEILEGRVFKILRMPNQDALLILTPNRIKTSEDVEYVNRNVFCVTKEGHLIWQVERIDYPETNWELKHKDAREQGQPGCIEPFVGFKLIFPDGSTNMDLGMPPDVEQWRPDCTVVLANLGLGSQWYSLDVVTGIAIEITPKGFRPW